MTRALLQSLRVRRRLLLPAAACVLLAIAVLLPDFKLARRAAQVVVMLDVSQSMNTPDCRLDRSTGPAASRLACAKQALAHALRDMPCGAQLAWGVFTGYQAFVLSAPVEVCAHRGELLDVLRELDWRVTWEPGSQIGRSLASALRLVPQVPHQGQPVPGLVFVTDGHEAPPVALRNRFRLDDFAGRVPGVIVGVGGRTLTPIPKHDMDGRYLGEWGADDVPQKDPSGTRALSSVPGERMVGAEDDDAAPTGTEHLSSLREEYLQQLARDAGLGYRRLARAADMLAVLKSQELRRPLDIDTDLRWIPGLGALLLLLFA
jgi:mxaL protein